jgi:hypothetical protein
VEENDVGSAIVTELIGGVEIGIRIDLLPQQDA